jgi:hypothetical protein
LQPDKAGTAPAFRRDHKRMRQAEAPLEEDTEQAVKAAVAERRQAVGELVHSRIEQYAKAIRRLHAPDRSHNEEHFIEAALTEWRQAVGELVHSRIEQYAKAIGGLRASDRSQFEEHVLEALRWSTVFHFDAENRKRPGKTRKELLRVAKETAAAEKHLERLGDALGKLESEWRETLDRRLDFLSKIESLVMKQPPWFYALSDLSNMARFYAEMLSDEGGAPKMVAFSALIRGLKRAFENATGLPAKVTKHPYREQFEGKFLQLVESVLPLALEVVGDSHGRMPYPESPRARGKYVHEATKAKRKRAASQYPKP